MEIKITQKDLKKHDISYSDSGLVIDELAYCAGEYTYDEMYVNNLDDEPNEPYIYNYETDLFEQTKTREELNNIIELLGLGIPIGLSVHNQSNIQAGAQFALNAPEIWAEILEAYTQKLKENGTYNNISISKKYDIAIAKERSSYHQDMYREWLYGDRQYYAGIIYEIAKKFTNTRKSEYNEKKDTYTFFLDECDIEDAKYQGYNKNQGRAIHV